VVEGEIDRFVSVALVQCIHGAQTRSDGVAIFRPPPAAHAPFQALHNVTAEIASEGGDGSFDLTGRGARCL
jgi:hypothetical protein